MKKTFPALLAITLISFSLLSGCSKKYKPSYDVGNYAPLPESSSESAERKIAVSVSMSAESEDLERDIPKLELIVDQYNGFVEQKKMSDEVAVFALKIPADETLNFAHDVKTLLNVKEYTKNVEDITDEYADARAELENLKSLRNRLRVLLDRADDVPDILAVEKELNRAQTMIDQLEGRIKRYEDRVEYSRVSLWIEKKEKTIYGPLGYVFVGAGWVLEKLFIIKEG